MDYQQVFADIPIVQIDDEGLFKYVLIKVCPRNADGQEKILVRGFKWGIFHRYIFQDLEAKLRELGFESTCLGGGRIWREPSSKKMKVYGFSTNYGQADHELTTRLLKEAFSDYDITWSNDGY